MIFFKANALQKKKGLISEFNFFFKYETFMMEICLLQVVGNMFELS